jgi:hypothetical protein
MTAGGTEENITYVETMIKEDLLLVALREDSSLPCISAIQIHIRRVLY